MGSPSDAVLEIIGYRIAFWASAMVMHIKTGASREEIIRDYVKINSLLAAHLFSPDSEVLPNLQKPPEGDNGDILPLG